MSDTSIPQRTCTKCKQSLPATLEHFHYQKRGKYGLASRCIACHNQRNKENSAKLREKPEYREAQRLYDKQHYQDRRDYYIEHNHKYYADNHEKELERTRIKSRVNFDKYRPQRLKRNHEYYQKHKKEIRQAASKRHADKMLNDPHYIVLRKSYHQRRRALKRNAPGSHTSADILMQRKAQTDKQGHLRCWWCNIVIKSNNYHLDHKHPLSRGGSNGADNIVITCPTCNLSKNNKTPAEWAGWLL